MLDRLETVTYPDNITTYTYDAAYNRDSETVTSVDGLTTIKDLDHIYNARNQLTEINDLLDAAQNVTYSFDGNGNQTQKTQNTMTTDFVYDASNSTLAKYDYGPNRLLSLNHVAEGLQFYLTDALNSVTNLTRADGEKKWDKKMGHTTKQF